MTSAMRERVVSTEAEGYSVGPARPNQIWRRGKGILSDWYLVPWHKLLNCELLAIPAAVIQYFVLKNQNTVQQTSAEPRYAANKGTGSCTDRRTEQVDGIEDLS